MVAEESPSFRYLYYKVCENNYEWNEYVGAATLLYGQAESSECARHATTEMIVTDFYLGLQKL